MKVYLRLALPIAAAAALLCTGLKAGAQSARETRQDSIKAFNETDRASRETKNLKKDEKRKKSLKIEQEAKKDGKGPVN